MKPTNRKRSRNLFAPLAEQERFARVASRYVHLRAQQQVALRQAEMLFGALLKKAFEGEV